MTRILARLAVPFFLMVTGHFVLFFPPDKVKKYLKSSLKAYLAVTLLYLPLSIYGGYFEDFSPYTPLKLLLFDGVYYHLWYFPAVIMGILIVRFLQKHFSHKSALAICVFLYFIGLLGDSYYGFAAEILQYRPHTISSSPFQATPATVSLWRRCFFCWEIPPRKQA